VAGLRGFVAGEGPVILLVHGWGGWASRLGAFVRPLVETGHQVVGMDLPAHGSSSGRRTNPFEMADALRKVAGSVGPVRALVSHSFGGLVSLLAMERGLKTEAAVLLAPALRADQIRARFAELFRLRPPVMNALVRVLDGHFGSDVWEVLDGRRIAYNLSSRGPDVPVLIAHDPEDRDALFSDAHAISQILPRARILRAKDTGHHHILVEESVVTAAVEFVTGLQHGNGEVSIPAARTLMSSPARAPLARSTSASQVPAPPPRSSA
jgi:pimeloyl-ACP methyl ester carboxylesterase